MKVKPIITVLLLAFVATSIGYLLMREPKTAASSAPAAPANAAKPAPGTARFVAFYFHSTRRCHTCRTIEAQAQEAIQTGFAEELRQGRLAWRPVNLEEPGNEHFASEYEVTGSTLVIAEVREQKPARFAKLDKTWKLVHDKPAFMDYVVTEVSAFIGSGR